MVSDYNQFSYFNTFRTKDPLAPVYQGLGQIEFADGSLYTGLTKNGLFEGKGRL